MCKIKVGKEVQDYKDLQNLVTSVILRQESDFTKLDLINEISKKLVDSNFSKNQKNIERMTDRTLEILERVEFIEEHGGLYSSTQVISSF